MLDHSPQSTQVAEPRVVRVFISSTFRDMHAERDELVKRTFPQLRKLCEERGVTWGEVDLRWGVSDEQKAEGKVLPVCLAEIHRCRPYFIGLLGERYGWVPDEIPRELIEGEPWLAEHLGHSVTELEILHGVLNSPAMADRALFYFRDQSFINSLPREQQSDFLEIPTADEIARLGQEEAERRAEDRKRKLAALKNRIRQSGLPVRENYPNPQALGEMVLRDLTEIIDHLYPADERLDPLDREALDHDAFALSRAKVYIGRQAYYDRLDEHARNDGPPLVVLGESGSGKSALLSNWALRYRSAHPGELLLMHFIGATPFSADWAAMLRRTMGEFKHRFDIQGEIPDKPDELRATLANWLHMAAARGKVVLILDALNQLEDRDCAPDLIWLPPVIPSNIRLIVSTLPGRPLDDLERRGWPTMPIESLDVDERKQLVSAYLAQSAKQLDQAREKRIAHAKQTANPLYLRALLDELQVFGIHEELDARIDHYLKAKTVAKLYEKILVRYEKDYERERAGLVGEAMSLLWAARRGLSEIELLELLGTNQEPMPRAHWSPLYLAAESSLISQSGVIGFGHDYLRQAVRNKYVRTKRQQQKAHLRLADYFEDQNPGVRKIDELPWQLTEATAWQRLYDLLAEPEFFTTAWNANEFEVKACWAKMEAGSSFRMVDAYRFGVRALVRTHYAWDVGTLLADAGHTEEALSLRERLVETYRRTGDRENLQASLGNKATILYKRGDVEEAMSLYKEQERICRELRDDDGLQTSLGNQAVVLKLRGEWDEAMRLQKEKERICRELGNKAGLATSLGNQAIILRQKGELDEAMRLHKEEERIYRELGDKDGLSASLGNRANIFHARGELDEAMRLQKEKERICRELGNKDGLSGSLGNQANIFYARGELDEAMRLQKEKERICRELGNKDGLATSLGGQGVILAARGELDQAIALWKEEEGICRELGNTEGLATCFGNQALILCDRGELTDAMALLKKEEQIWQELGNKSGLASCLNSQASILRDRGQLDEAMTLHKEEEQICRALRNKDGLQYSLDGQARILRQRGELDEAMRLRKEEERICRELGDRNGLQKCLGHQGLVLYDKGELDESMALLKEQERLCRELKNKVDLELCLGAQAGILQTQGNLDEAAALHREVEQICRESGNREGLARSLIIQAGLLARQRGRLGEALTLAEEAYKLASSHGLTTLAEQIKPSLDYIRGKALPWWKRLIGRSTGKKPKPPTGI